ncbi:MAG: hypothetical protein M3O02_11005 [Acidobacteriota bacterium]|nr:hypothetical protein [Acidobacteriota bacterium]
MGVAVGAVGAIGAVDAARLLSEAQALLERRELDAAEVQVRRAEAAGADADGCAAGLWTVHMLRGEFEEAWRQSDAIRARGAPDPHRFWNGEPVEAKRVIVRCLHGLGDAVQMMRYMPALERLCAELTVEVPPALVEPARWFDGVHRVITWGADAPPEAPDWDVQVEVMELPYLFRTRLAELPLAERYLKLPEEVRDAARRAMGVPGLPRVGFVWAAGEWNPARSLPVELVGRMVAATRCECWNLQGGRHRTDWAHVPGTAATRDACEVGEGIVSLAAAIEQLDLVITVDTLAAHLAGALGIPAWVLVQHAADWRWMAAGRDSPWYPTVRLYRQGAPGDWAGVVDDVVCDLQAWAARRPETPRAG